MSITAVIPEQNPKTDMCLRGSFSYREYGQILGNLPRGRIMTFAEAFRRASGGSTADFVILRHDVEVSVDKAVDLARIECEMDIRSTYFFQVRSGGYNILAAENIRKIQSIQSMGHDIGLHFHMDRDAPPMPIEYYQANIQKDRSLMETFLNIGIQAFSIHRPSPFVLECELCADGMVNTYDPLFFAYSRDPETIRDNAELPLYLADSEHAWKYGYPDRQTIQDRRRVQILMHPYSWSEQGFGREDNFRDILDSKHREMLEFLRRENRNFPF